MSPLLALVHSPLVGAATWQAVAESLRSRGEQVVVPDLTPALESGPPYVERQAAAVKRIVGAESVILVGHSGAGPLLPAFGSQLRVAGYVFVDAGLPTPGRTWMDTAPTGLVDQLEAMAVEGWLPPWSRWWGEDGLAELLPEEQLRRQFAEDCPRLPLAMFRERRPQLGRWPDAGCVYLALSDGYSLELERARSLGWTTAELPSHHLGMLTDPGVVADSILALLERCVDF
jgi:hypothetical protein